MRAQSDEVENSPITVAHVADNKKHSVKREDLGMKCRQAAEGRKKTKIPHDKILYLGRLYNFKLKPEIHNIYNIDEEKAMDIALEAGADDVVTNEDGSIDVYTSPEAFPSVVDAFNDNNIKPDNAQVTMTPSTEAALDADTAVKFMRMIDALEDLDDVQEVYHNASIPDDVNLD